MADTSNVAQGEFPVPITVEFTYVKSFLQFDQPLLIIDFNSGGLELLFGNERKHKVVLPARLEDGSRPNISYLLKYLVDNLMKDQRIDMFIMEDNVYVNAFSSSSMMPIGNSKAKRHMNFNKEITLFLSQLYMAVKYDGLY
ncbi:Pc12g04510 [Penicillium rubens Wisconsin 54-1255]|uniref:Ubiquitin-related modifier 1 n=1 Tax=Penicillium rubens (strain ATCC 28089 / DSM 1075 / NRRL 1951 / Wisconsin 54-1255) TaxID=500485 RepID=B6GXX4_PENRW|nr:Pc12g04510 [Penicillium rubens Wisconsin 54-1255]